MRIDDVSIVDAPKSMGDNSVCLLKVYFAAPGKHSRRKRPLKTMHEIALGSFRAIVYGQNNEVWSYLFQEMLVLLSAYQIYAETVAMHAS